MLYNFSYLLGLRFLYHYVLTHCPGHRADAWSAAVRVSIGYTHGHSMVAGVNSFPATPDSELFELRVPHFFIQHMEPADLIRIPFIYTTGGRRRRTETRRKKGGGLILKKNSYSDIIGPSLVVCTGTVNTNQ